jgi:hypothetical protein
VIFARIRLPVIPEGELMNGITIRKVRAKSDLKRSIRFPWRVYENDLCWVPPIIMEMKEKLNRRKYPFFEHAEADYLLACRGEKIVGRIAAILIQRFRRPAPISS